VSNEDLLPVKAQALAVKAAAKAEQEKKEVASAQQPPGTVINKEVKKELQKQQRIFQQLEMDIARLTSQKKDLEASLTNPSTYSDKSKFVAAENNYAAAAQELSKLNFQYEQVFEKIVTLEANLTVSK